MPPRSTSRFVATLALLICFGCPILEVFDYWDRTTQTGNDTEYTLVVLALCVGAALIFARLSDNDRVFRVASRFGFRSASSFCLALALLFLPEVSLSPPLTLRL